MNPPLPPNSDDTTAAEERRLRELFRDAAPDYIDDAGFTARVIGRLPVSSRRSSRRRTLLVGAAVLLGGACAALGAGAELLDLGASGWALLSAWSARPVPMLGQAMPLGSLVVAVVALGVGRWAYARE